MNVIKELVSIGVRDSSEKGYKLLPGLVYCDLMKMPVKNGKFGYTFTGLPVIIVERRNSNERDSQTK